MFIYSSPLAFTILHHSSLFRQNICYSISHPSRTSLPCPCLCLSPCLLPCFTCFICLFPSLPPEFLDFSFSRVLGIWEEKPKPGGVGAEIQCKSRFHIKNLAFPYGSIHAALVSNVSFCFLMSPLSFPSIY